MKNLAFALLVLAGLFSGAALGQGSGTRDLGSYLVHYSVVNTTFISPEVAASYDVVRGRDRAFINIAVQEKAAEGNVPRPARISGRTWDLFRNQFLEFREIREQQSIYYIAEFKFDNEDIRFFKLDLLPEGAERSWEIKFNHRVYEN